jgi:hypothetical protein
MKASWQLVKNPDYDEAFLRAFTVPVEDWHWTRKVKRSLSVPVVSESEHYPF